MYYLLNIRYKLYAIFYSKFISGSHINDIDPVVLYITK